ncbi:MAG: NERD domain-containing protein [FCB group bacterium]|nr:NERD domain-containing protein [FCB group bacterium]
MRNTLKLKDRISETIDNKEPFVQEAHIQAGHDAEYMVRKLINQRIKRTGWKVFSSIRVPDEKNNLRREYDFIITSPTEVFAIELKNWSGDLVVNHDEFIQYRRYNGGRVNHGKILQDLIYKVDLLKSYCKQDEVKILSIFPLLVFYNSKLNIPNEIAENKMVLRYNQFKKKLPQSRHVSVGLLEAILIHLGLREPRKSESIPKVSDSIAALHNILDSFGTWDIIEYNGSKKNKKIGYGDILGDGKNEVKLGNIIITDRKYISSIDVKVDRSNIRAFFSDPRYRLLINYRDNNKATLTFNKNTSIKFQSAGSENSVDLFLRNLVRTEFGYLSRNIFQNPWESLQAGMKFEGKITRNKPYGVFIDIGVGRDGLLHISEVPDTNSASFAFGDKILVEVKFVDKVKKEISLKLPTS